MERDLNEIEAILRDAPQGMTSEEIRARVTKELTGRQVRYRLRALKEQGRIHVEGAGRGRTYFAVRGSEKSSNTTTTSTESTSFFSKASQEILKAVQQPLSKRAPVGYDEQVLDSYVPNESSLLGDRTRHRLAALGAGADGDAPAGTYARQIMERLIIDLSWSSSHLEGNTYTLLDTRRLIEHGEVAQGKELRETQMILNHKRAIEFLVEDVAEFGPRANVVTNLHAILMENLLMDPAQAGQIRSRPVGITLSTFTPLSTPQKLRELFYRMLALAREVEDPLEQSFFLFVHIAYLQPFIDGNKRTARLAANIPLIRKNYRPLTFVDVPRDGYLWATLAFYETTRLEPLRELYAWAYERSCSRYDALTDVMAEPDPFRLRHRDLLHEGVRLAVVSRAADAEALVEEFAAEHFDDVAERVKFQGLVMADLDALHEGNYMRYRISPSQFEAWMRR